MNIVKSFAKYLEDESVATLGQNLFIGGAPSSKRIDNDLYWLLMSGGTPFQSMETGEKIKDYSIELYYRNRSSEKVYDTLQELEEKINCFNCLSLEGYDVLDVETSVLGVDEDLDGEDRHVGLLQVNIRIHKNCEIGVS